MFLKFSLTVPVEEDTLWWLWRMQNQKIRFMRSKIRSKKTWHHCCVEHVKQWWCLLKLLKLMSGGICFPQVTLHAQETRWSCLLGWFRMNLCIVLFLSGWWRLSRRNERRTTRIFWPQKNKTLSPTPQGQTVPSASPHCSQERALCSESVCTPFAGLTVNHTLYLVIILKLLCLLSKSLHLLHVCIW